MSPALEKSTGEWTARQKSAPASHLVWSGHEGGSHTQFTFLTVLEKKEVDIG